MSETVAMPFSWLMQAAKGAPRPACPSCGAGEPHPYKVSFLTQGWEGTYSLHGFVATCQGNSDEGSGFVTKPCGFSMPLQPMKGRHA